MKFEWDGEKEIINVQKHGVSFEQASYVFADPFALNKYMMKIHIRKTGGCFWGNH